jgi:hypothetical protein
MQKSFAMMFRGMTSLYLASFHGGIKIFKSEAMARFCKKVAPHRHQRRRPLRALRAETCQIKKIFVHKKGIERDDKLYWGKILVKDSLEVIRVGFYHDACRTAALERGKKINTKKTPT